MKDAYLQYQGFKVCRRTRCSSASATSRRFNTFEDETSDRFVDTMERAAFINAWDIDRQIGFVTMYYAEHFGLAAGIFGERVSVDVADASALPGLHRG